DAGRPWSTSVLGRASCHCCISSSNLPSHNARSLCGKQRSKQLHFLCSPKYCWRISHISLQRGFHTSKIKCKWTQGEVDACSKHCYSPSNHGLHTGILKLSTFAPKGLARVSVHMSHLKSTLNFVSKAVFGNQNEMISRDWLKQKNIKQTIKFLKKSSTKSAEKNFPEKKSHGIGRDEGRGKQSLFHTRMNLCSESSFYTVDKPASLSGTSEVFPVSTKQSTANLLSCPTEGVQALAQSEQEEAIKAEKTVSKNNKAEEQKHLTTKLPEGKGVASEGRIIPYLLRLGQIKDGTLQVAVREILALIGYCKKEASEFSQSMVDEQGMWLLSRYCRNQFNSRRSHFVSSLIAFVVCHISFMLGLFHTPLGSCSKYHGKQRDNGESFGFRIYGHSPEVNSHCLGGCRYKMWPVTRASSVASCYFAEDVFGGNDLHQDGGLLLHNPSVLAMHECKCLGPGVPLVHSIPWHWMLSIATDIDVHVILNDLLLPGTYFILSPAIHENIPLDDESQNEKLDQLQLEGLKYIDRNEEKVKDIAKSIEKILSRKIQFCRKLMIR
ncbi:hypothetical protein HPG69_013746, partial [Diceros bicornis minor]